MLRDIRKIELKGAIFDSLTPLDLFDPHEGNKIKTVKGTLVYGRNGTGKSTIAKAFRKLSGEIISTITDTNIYDDLGACISLPTEETKHIFVFDEEYVDRNVRLQEDHLETIVMLGEAVDLTEKIEKAKIECDKYKQAYEQQNQVFAEYCDSKNVKSPKYYLNKLSNALRGDDNWAGRDREISGSRQNTGVRDDTYMRFESLTPVKTKTELILEYKLKLEELKAVKTGVGTIDSEVPTIPSSYQEFNDKTLLSLLEQEIEKPELSEREQKLLLLLQDGKREALLDRMKHFQNKNTSECPYCFQSITAEHKESLVESIKKVLSEIVEEHQNNLRQMMMEPISIDLSLYKKLNGYQLCVDLLEQINISIQKYTECLIRKVNNPYKPIIIDDEKVQDLLIKINLELSNLEKARLEYNKTMKKTRPIITELNRINSEIAFYDIKDLAEQYHKQEAECRETEKLVKTQKKLYDLKKKEVEDLEAQRSNVQLAVDTINACLKYIFFAEDRLKIEYVNGAYKLLSYGKSVKPCDISEGERNIIGLSYFFTSILRGKEEKQAYNEEYLIVVDDPVSSFDVENRIGILSFLKYKISMFLLGNMNTRVLVMTHDLKTFYDIHKIFEEIITACKQEQYANEPKFNRFEIRKKELIPFSYNKRQEYTELVCIVYKYAMGQDDSYEIIIGNMMRQILEAFSTFEYKKGIEEISTDEKILDLLPEKEYIPYYRNLMYRLVLHGGSHRADQIKVMDDFNFFSLISETEKKRTAKDILCFIYLLNKQHLLQHLQGYKSVEENLNSWCKDIKKRSTPNL